MKPSPPRDPAWRIKTIKALRGEEGVPEDFVEFANVINRMYDDPMVPLGEWEENDATRFIRSNHQARVSVELMLYEGVSLEVIRDSLSHRFKAHFSPEEVDCYRALYWDVNEINGPELAAHLTSTNELHLMPKKPQVTGRFRAAHAAFEKGYADELDMDAAMRHMFARDFFESERVIEHLGIGGIDIALRLQGAAASIYNSIQKADSNRKASGKLPTAFDVEIDYKDSTATPVDMVIGYDPAEDDGSDLADSEYEEIKQRGTAASRRSRLLPK